MQSRPVLGVDRIEDLAPQPANELAVEFLGILALLDGDRLVALALAHQVPLGGHGGLALPFVGRDGVVRHEVELAAAVEYAALLDFEAAHWGLSAAGNGGRPWAARAGRPISRVEERLHPWNLIHFSPNVAAPQPARRVTRLMKNTAAATDHHCMPSRLRASCLAVAAGMIMSDP